MTAAANDLFVPIVLTLLGVAVSFAAAIAISWMGSTSDTQTAPAPPCRSRFLGERCTSTGPHDLHTHHERFWWDSASEDPREDQSA
mgnify:CR=1 FL=1